MIRLVVLGTPATQGSKRGFVNKGRVQLVESSEKTLRPWREAVRSEAQRWVEGYDDPIARADLLVNLANSPIAVHLHFGMARPQSAPKRRRTWPTGARSGDIDKLARACLDALTGVLFADDSQVVELVATKDYSALTGCVVVIEPLYEGKFRQLVRDAEELGRPA
jgi:crossover junction endodeoxyribonuclease RusA